MYIVLEGIVGTGKSTQAKLLVAYLKKQFPDKRIEYVREPWTTQIAEAIRTLVQGTEFDEPMNFICEAYLFAAARAQLLHTTVRPLLEEWSIVVADRSFLSSLAYQGKAKWLWIQTVFDINSHAIASVMPDCILYFTCPPAYALARTSDAAWDKFERMWVEFFEQIQAWYDEVSRLDALSSLRHTIDATWTIPEVSARIHTVLSNLWYL